jgi:RNA-directed DNA polymerase
MWLWGVVGLDTGRSDTYSISMKNLATIAADEAKTYFLKSSSYFNGDFPPYVGFGPMLANVDHALGGQPFSAYQDGKPHKTSGVNYGLIANKDGRLAWRHYELINPAVYVSLVNLICENDNWNVIKQRFLSFQNGIVECCSSPAMADDNQSDKAAQVGKWWKEVEQKSLTLSLDYSHLLHTDVTDCYGSLYTHAISWAIHGVELAKNPPKDANLLGDKIDSYVRAGRFGQTNGISQGSALMDFLAELILGYIDELISAKLGNDPSIRIIRYRDDYRIFANGDDQAERAFRAISDCLREVGMRLGPSKTLLSANVIEGSLKPDKLAGIELHRLGETTPTTIQKQLLRLHAFGCKFPNSGALRRLLSELHSEQIQMTEAPPDLDVQIAIAADIAVVSPQTIPAVSGILSHLLSLASTHKKADLWSKVRVRMAKVPHNGYLDIWLQRVAKPHNVALEFHSDEGLCRIVDGKPTTLWQNGWISSSVLLSAMDPASIITSNPTDVNEVVKPEEIQLFTEAAWSY